MTSPLPPFYDRYINLCNNTSLIEAFEKYTVLNVLEENKLTELGDSIYAEGKWNIKQVIQHCIDTERIMSYRALRFARNDRAELPGFDQDLYVAEAPVSERNVADLLKEFDLVRQTTKFLFQSLPVESLSRKGTASEIEISVEHIGFMLIGHLIHHQNILAERYYPLSNAAS